MNKAYPALLVLTFGFIANVHAYDLKLGLSTWSAEGDFDMTGGPPWAANTWNLNHPVDSDIQIISGEMNLNDGVALEVAYGAGDIDRGVITDTDYDGFGTISDLSFSTSSGETSLFSINAHLRPTRDEDNYIEVTLGYLYQKNSVDYRDPFLVIDNYIPVNINWSEVWLIYDIEYSGLKLGFRGKFPLTSEFLLKGSIGWMPYLEVDYTGLRYPQRPIVNQEPEKIVADGTALDLEIAASILPAEMLSIDIGYRLLKFKAEGFDSPGTAWAYSWEEFKSDMHGPFLSVNYIF